ncbi:MAG: hypothetical protein GVY13_00385, partial [Alphaproteobacteria bacterium]|nr:hypothetical protein [Alphaproteobacteria bacterium]
MANRRIRVWAKAGAAGITLGIVAGAGVVAFANQMEPAHIESLRIWLAWPLPLIENLFGANPEDNGLGSPLVLAAFGAATFAIQVTLLLAGGDVIGRRPIIDYVWPEPPDILDLKLFRKDVDPDDPQFEGRHFHGRQDELSTLRRFAGLASGDGPIWTTLEGPHGVGKTRLALEWLNQLRTNGWDVGWLDPAADLRSVRNTHFRRKTAVLIDEAARQIAMGLWPKIDLLLQRRCYLRILLIDQTPLTRPGDLDKAVRDRIDAAKSEGVRLEELNKAALREIAPDATDEAVDRADGRPLYVLLGPDPAATIARRVERWWDKAQTDLERRLVAFAALAGPVPNTEWKRLLTHVDVALPRRSAIFGGERRHVLDEVLPQPRPEPLANALLLRWAADQDRHDREALFQTALTVHPEAVEARLHSLWMDHVLDEMQARLRWCFQKQFDSLAPERVATLLRKARESLDATIGNQWEVALTHLRSLAERRPFDREIRLRAAMGAVNAIHRYGEHGRFEDLERWGGRLIATAEAFPADRELRVEEAVGAVNAISRCGEHGRFEDLERWGGRLIATAEAFPADREIRL